MEKIITEKERFLEDYPVEKYGSIALKIFLNDKYRFELTQEELTFFKELNLMGSDDPELEGIYLDYVKHGVVDFFNECSEEVDEEFVKYVGKEDKEEIVKPSLEEQREYIQSQIKAWNEQKRNIEKEMEKSNFSLKQRNKKLAEKIEEYENEREDDNYELDASEIEAREAVEYAERIIEEGISI